MQHVNGKSRADFWTASGVKQLKDKYSQFQKQYKFRRQSHWKSPFEVPETDPIVLDNMVVGEGQEVGEMKIDMLFTKEALDRYDELNKSPDFLGGCKNKDTASRLLDLLLLDIRILLSCDPLATKGRKEIREDSPGLPGGGAPIVSAADGDDASDNGAQASDGPQAKADYMYWTPYSPMAVKWTEMGLTDPNVIESSKFFPACSFFFYIDALSKEHPDINNALHKAWLDKFKKPMAAIDLDEPPETFSEEARLWYSSTVEYLQGQLNDTERALRGLPPKQRASSRTLALAGAAAAMRAPAAAKAPAGAAAAKRAPARTAGGTSGSDSDEVTPSKIRVKKR
jgi:hypothetical protein